MRRNVDALENVYDFSSHDFFYIFPL